MKYRTALKPLLKSFSAKVFFSLVTAMVILFTLLSYLHNRTQIADFEEDIQREGKTLTKVTATAVRLGLFAENAEMLQEAIRPTLTSEGVLAMSRATTISPRKPADNHSKPLAAFLKMLMMTIPQLRQANQPRGHPDHQVVVKRWRAKALIRASAQVSRPAS